MRPNRSTKVLGALALGMLGIAIGPFSTANGATDRGASSALMLDLDGMNAGYIKSETGGAPDVVTAANQSSYRSKHIGDAVFTPIVITTPLVTAHGIFTKAQRWLARSDAPFNGDIDVLDANGKVAQVTTFSQTAITEVDFPALNSSSKDEESFTLHMQPTTVRVAPGSGAATPAPQSAVKSPLVSNFRFSVQDLNTDHVFSVSGITVTSAANGAQNPPTLKVEIADGDSASWTAWTRSHETRSGTLDYLTADNRSVVLELQLAGLRLVAIDQVPPTSTSSVKTLRITMLVTQVQMASGSLLN
jgi:hypothetical protein